MTDRKDSRKPEELRRPEREEEERKQDIPGSEAEENDDEFERLRRHNASDALLRSLAFRFEEEFASEYDRFREEMPDARVPEELDKKIRAEIRRHGREENAARSGKKYAGILAKACVFVLAVSLTATVLFAPQASALRQKVYELFTEQNDGNMSVDFQETDPKNSEAGDGSEETDPSQGSADKTDFPEGEEYILYPSAMPEGYELEEIHKFANSIDIYFYNEERDDWITMGYYDIDSVSTNIDTERSRITEMTINGQPAILQEMEDYIGVIWIEDQKQVYIDFNSLDFDVEQALEIVDSVQWYDRESFEKMRENS